MLHLLLTDSELAQATNDADSRPRDVITTSYPTPSKSKAAQNLAQRQRATWPPFLKDSENIDSQSERSASYFGEGERQEFQENRRAKEDKESDEKLERSDFC